MEARQLGEIPIEDYLKIINYRPRRARNPWKKTVLGVAGLALCLLCTAAGDYLGPWSGKNARALTFEMAVETLRYDTDDSRLRAAAEVVRRHSCDGIHTLVDLRNRVPALLGTTDVVLGTIKKIAEEAR